MVTISKRVTSATRRRLNEPARSEVVECRWLTARQNHRVLPRILTRALSSSVIDGEATSYQIRERRNVSDPPPLHVDNILKEGGKNPTGKRHLPVPPKRRFPKFNS
jgi:hypothetical protein